jgi:uncharacterized protein
MKQLFTILFLSISFVALSQTNEKNFIDQNYIEVTGSAEMEIVPDLIYVNIVLVDKENKNKLSLSEIEILMIGKLTETGIDVKKDLAIKDFTGNLRSYWFSKADVVLMKQYQLTIHETAALQKAFIALQNLGITSVTIERLDHTQIDQFRKEVKINAIKAAKDKAQALTMAIGQSIGKAIYIQEVDNAYLQANTSNANILIRGTSSDYSKVESSDIEFEKIKLNYSILVRFELK